MSAFGGNVHVVQRPKPGAKPRGYDRNRVLKKASDARRGGRRKKAIELYRTVLADEPDNVDVLRKLAPLLAECRQKEEALRHFGRAAQGLAARGFPDKAIGLCRQALGFYPTEVVIWKAIADLQLQRQRRADAFAALLEGRAKMRGRRLRRPAIALLERACAVDPGAVDPQIDLAMLLARTRQRGKACARLDRLAACCHGRDRRRALGARLRIAPTPIGFFRWCGAVFGR